MKITAVRLIYNKDPVGIFCGWVSDSSMNLKLINESTSPLVCEYLETEISENRFGLLWRKARKGDELFPPDMEFAYELKSEIMDMFTVGYYPWTKIQAHDENKIKQIAKLNHEVSLLRKNILARERALQNSNSMITSSIMFMFAAWVVAAISIALLILK